MTSLRYVEANGVCLTYDDVGEGRAILFVHGFMFDGTMWRGQTAALEGWRRIAPDLRGHGLSEVPERGYSMATYADDLAALLDDLGVRRTVLCELSMGGYIAFEFLRRHLERTYHHGCACRGGLAGATGEAQHDDRSCAGERFNGACGRAHAEAPGRKRTG
jgi:pimeloyl-ACP methyl ester carboxylesterase